MLSCLRWFECRLGNGCYGANAMALPIDEVPGFFTGAWMVRATGIADPKHPTGDLNGDGVVDVSDLLLLLANWS